MTTETTPASPTHTTATGTYLGELRCENVHTQSGSVLPTDAPTDNKGKGEAFSPTDLLATALGACIVTTMGIVAMDMKVDLTGSTWTTVKEMHDAPRKVGPIRIRLAMKTDRPLTDDEKARLERIMHACPVARSLAESVEQDVTIEWN